FLEKIKINKLNDEKYKNNFEVYNSSIHEIKALEELNIVKDWNEFFSNTTSGFLKFFLNYLRYKELKEYNLSENGNIKFKVSDFYNSSEIMRDNLVILNASSNILAQNENNFLLSNKQRDKLTLKRVEDNKLIEKYKFMRNILNSKNTLVFSKKSLEDNISESSYMEELVLKYNLKIKEANFSEKNLNKVIKGIFDSKVEKIQDFSQRKFPINFKNEKLKMEEDDFSELSSLSYYRYNRIKDCQYRYFLEFLVGLEKRDYEIEKQMNVMVFGSLVHEIFAKIVKKENLINSLEEDEIDVIINNVLDDYDLKINNYFEKYYNNILFKKVKKSVKNFLNGFNKRRSAKINELYTELSLKEWIKKYNLKDKKKIFYNSKYSNFYLNGRVDFLALTEKMNYIVDFKTGGSNTEQLDLYELMLFSENNEVKLKKMIYNVIDEKFKSSYKSKEKFASDLREELEKFTKKNYYTRIYKSRCNTCPYSDICKVVRK
ncbi:MAG: PD-(D/E)XK nuclease family protein, partial [Bacillota bacterium]